MSRGNDLFLLLLNLSQMQSRDAIMALFLESLGALFAPVAFAHADREPDGSGPSFAITTRKSAYGFVVPSTGTTLSGEDRSSLSNAAQMLAIMLERLDFEANLEKERMSISRIAEDRLSELERAVEHLRQSRNAYINLAEDQDREIANRKKVEEALRESEETYRALVDGLPDIVMRFDRAGRHLFVSDKVRETVGLEAGKLIGKTHAELGFPETQCRFWEESIRRVFDSGMPFETEFTIEGQAGSMIFNWRLVPEYDDLGKVSSVLSISRNITGRRQAEAEREKLQAQLTQAQKMESVGRLAGGVTHDFNNMLGVILGHTEMALEKVAPGEPLHANLAEIRSAAERSADLTRQLLAFARKQTVAPKVLDLNHTVESMLKLLRRLIGEDIDLAWRPGRGLWLVRLDPAQIDQILANLCVNARDAIAGVGKVTIETANAVFDEDGCARSSGLIPGEYVLLAVSDDGCGMDSGTLAHIFEPFFTTKQIGQGTGLGLASVYGAVKQNNGFVNVYSEPGQGTTFKIYLPRYAAQAAAETQEPRLQAAAHGSETVLLVEDEPAILKMTTMTLARLGYNVLAVTTPGEAIGLAREYSGRIDLLLTDVIMPEMNGRVLAKSLKATCPEMRCLFMSGYTADVVAHCGVLDEGVHFIQKPFSGKDLGAKIREALCRDE